jgi:hypothetical protein
MYKIKYEIIYITISKMADKYERLLAIVDKMNLIISKKIYNLTKDELFNNLKSITTKIEDPTEIVQPLNTIDNIDDFYIHYVEVPIEIKPEDYDNIPTKILKGNQVDGEINTVFDKIKTDNIDIIKGIENLQEKQNKLRDLLSDLKILFSYANLKNRRDEIIKIRSMISITNKTSKEEIFPQDQITSPKIKANFDYLTGGAPYSDSNTFELLKSNIEIITTQFRFDKEYIDLIDNSCKLIEGMTIMNVHLDSHNST